MEHMTLIKNETQDIDLPCHITDLGGVLNLMDKGKFQNSTALALLRAATVG
jgi:hypothetical protein